jgi:multidrug efflux pump subunit AcrB
MNFATWSIRNPIPSILLFIVMTLMGLYGFKAMSIQDMPDIDLPTVTVALSLPGAVPSQLETEVARLVENSIANLTGIKHIRTSIAEGVVAIKVEFVLEKPLSDALIETTNAVDSVRDQLPTDMLPPVVNAVHFASHPLVTYAISGSKMDENALSWFVDDTLSKAILAIQGVGKFERIGGVDREIRVEVNPTQMAALNVTAAQISQTLESVQMESSGGRSQIGQIEQSVRTIGTVAQAADLETLSVTLADGRFIRLDQVATVTDGYAERKQKALLDGKPVVGFQFYGSKGADVSRLADEAAKVLAQVQAKNPNLVITPVNNTVDYAKAQYQGSMHMLYEGALLSVIVVWFFLRDWRATLISSVALPLSIIPTFAIMNWFGFTLNRLSLLALAVVVGILVDDAIVEIENIVRHKRMGKTMRQAAEEAVNEIAMAVMATTLVLVVVFLPTSFMSGIPGLLFRQFGWTIVISVMASLMVARLLTPVMSICFLRADQTHHAEADGRMMSSYLRMVHWCLGHRKSSAAMAVLFFVGSLGLATFLPKGFFPPPDGSYTTVNLELPPGNSLDSSLATTELARSALKDVSGIAHVFSVAGTAPDNGGQDVRNSAMTLIFMPRGQRPSQTQIEKDVSQKLLQVPGARITLDGGSPGEQMSIILSSDNSQALVSTAQEAERELRGIPAFNGISSTASLQRPEIVIRPDSARAAELGVTTKAIGDTVRIATAGDFDQQLSRLNLDNRQVYIRVSLADSARQDSATIGALRIPTKTGQTSLDTIATITPSTGPSQIDRYDRSRYVTITADLGDSALGDALDGARNLPAIKNMPSSVKLMDGGDAEIMGELFSGLTLAILTGVLAKFCVLILLFKDFFQPVTILSALPLTFGGSIIALLLTNGQMDLPALIGIVMLIGIVTKNSILLVDYVIVAMRDHGLSRHDAIIDACHKRARPIVMTTIAMIAGLMPIALGLGGDATFRQPMAIAVIGGLITSTALSLLMVPVIFTYINDLECWVRGFFTRR